ncbi:MAG: hypothetical protein ACREV4_13770 [Gammaproteobacteria bacterium]
MPKLGDTGVGNAFGGRLLYPNFNWNGALVFDQIGERFDPALGFVDLPGHASLRGLARIEVAC